MTDNYNNSCQTQTNNKFKNAFSKTSEALKGEMETNATILNLNLNSCQKQNQNEDCNNKKGRRKQRKLMLSISAMANKDWETFGRWTLIGLIFLGGSGFAFGDAALGPGNGVNGNWDRPGVMPKIKHLEVMCGNQHMEVHLAFDKPFHGLVTSKGMYGHQDCIYVPPRTGKDQFVFNIYYEKCGTKPDNHGKFYENTIVVQYDEELIEAWDEAKRLRCEWFNDYEKTATKTSPMVISDLEIVELNFHGDNVDCWMEIQEGKGPWASPLNGIAPLGSTLTMVIAVKDPSGEFDMRVKDCEASDGHSGRNLQLSDPEGCIVRPKLLGKFSKVKLDDGRATVLTYAFISAFKFPDMLNVHMRCTVEICRHGCPDHCTANSAAKSAVVAEPHPSQSIATETKLPAPKPPENLQNIQNHNLAQRFPQNSGENFNAPVPSQMRPPPPPGYNMPQMPMPYGGRPQRAPRPPPMGKFPLNRFPPSPRFTGTIKHSIPAAELQPPAVPLEAKFLEEQQRHHNTIIENMGMKPEPKSGEISQRSGEPSEGEELAQGDEGKSVSKNETEVEEKEEEKKEDREMLMEAQAVKMPKEQSGPQHTKTVEPVMEPTHLMTSNFPKGPRHLRLRRSVSGSSDVVGVQGTFRVVSQADLNFALNSNSTSSSTPTLVLRGRKGQDQGQGHLSAEPIYGICLPRTGFGLVFFGLGLATLVAILIAAFLTYAHYSVKNVKGVEGQGPMSMSMQNQEQLNYPFFPMVILRKMW